MSLLIAQAAKAPPPAAASPLPVGQAAVPSPTGPVRGYLVVSSDAAFIKRAKAPLTLFGSLAEFERAFASPRTKIVPWGDDYAIVFDLESGVFAWYHDRAVLLDALAAKVGEDRVLHVDDLDPAQAAALGNALGGPSYDSKTGAEIVPTAVGIQLSTVIVATRGSTTRSTESMDLDARQRMLAALARERQRAVSSTAAKPRPLPYDDTSDGVRLTVVTRIHGLSDGMEHTAPLIREIVKDLQKENERRFARLMAKLGGGEARMVEEMGRQSMSKEEWKAYGDRFARNYRPQFGSEAEARAYFDGSDSVRSYTKLSLQQIFQAYDPSRGQVGSGMEATLTTVPGVFGP